MARKRKSIGPKIRFEVFKRDSFRCQYCGRSAPDTILVIDHIKPVAIGGDDDITNLVTSCQDCNSGKGARELDDRSVIEKQRKQLEQLNERRLQLEMMLRWREELAGLNEAKTEAIVDALRRASGYGPNEVGLQTVSKWIAKFDLNEILDAIEISFRQYLQIENGEPTPASWHKAFAYVPRVINGTKTCAEKPYMKDLFYIRGILRSRLSYVPERDCLALLETAYKAGATIDELRHLSRIVRDWPHFVSFIEDFLMDHGVVE